MTVADSDRRTDAEKLLGALLEALGEGAIDTHLFESSRPRVRLFPKYELERVRSNGVYRTNFCSTDLFLPTSSDRVG
jgi:hypothetical protein